MYIIIHTYIIFKYTSVYTHTHPYIYIQIYIRPSIPNGKRPLLMLRSCACLQRDVNARRARVWAVWPCALIRYIPYIYICHMYLQTHICICIYTHTHTHINIYICICVFVCIYIYICVCVCVHTHGLTRYQRTLLELHGDRLLLVGRGHGPDSHLRLHDGHRRLDRLEVLSLQ